MKWKSIKGFLIGYDGKERTRKPLYPCGCICIQDSKLKLDESNEQCWTKHPLQRKLSEEDQLSNSDSDSEVNTLL